MMIDTLIINGDVYLNGKITKTNIGITGKEISYLGSDQPEASKILNASGLKIVRGIIDSQVHFREPGLTHKEDLSTGSLCALHGGVTQFFEMPNTNPSTTTVEKLQEKIDIAKKNCVTKFKFFIGGTRDNLEELKKAHHIPECCGIKIFFGSSTGNLLLNDVEAIERIFKETTLPISIHSEDEEILVRNLPIKERATSAHAHPEWRSVESALSSTKKLLNLARKCNRKIHLLHISTKDEMELLKDYKDVCTVEVLPQHLTLFAPDCYDRLGTYAQMNPPIRTKEHLEGLWKGIQDGTVDVIGSDHAPHTKEEKDKGYPNTPSGMPGVQTIVQVMLNHINLGNLSFDQFVKFMCENPARIFNQSQFIEIGKPADLSLINLSQDWEIRNEDMKTKCGWTPYHGMRGKGLVEHIFVDGKHTKLNTP